MLYCPASPEARDSETSFVNMWEYYHEKVIFLTGGTSFIGMTLLFRLLTQSSPKQVYVLCRGGHEYVSRSPSASKPGVLTLSCRKAREEWTSMLGSVHAKPLAESNCITILDGELGDTATMDLPDTTLQMLKQTVHIIIHAAAAAQLKNSLREVSYTIIAPTLCLTQYALKFPRLEKFVFLSSAYVNAHLWNSSTEYDVTVEERLYPVNEEGDQPHRTALDVWREVQAQGTSEEYEAHDWPWAYAYAKHLTERLILEQASEQNALDKFLIIRPSVVGPADLYPYHGFADAYSTASTACAAAYALHPGRKIALASRCADPEQQATIDEVPVDVVADRVLLHVAMGSTGCVHAVSGVKGRLRIEEWWHAFKKERRLPWKVSPVWSSDDWHSKDLHPIGKEFKILGTSFAFEDDKTVNLADSLTPHMRNSLRLFADRSLPYSLIHRRHHIHQMAKHTAGKTVWPACSVRFLCHSKGALKNI